MNTKEVFGVIFRYAIIISLGFGIDIIYIIFTPLTVYPVYWTLKELYGASLIGGNVIFSRGVLFDIAPACVAGSAYYLLLMLNLTTRMNFFKRIKNIIFIIFSFFVLNLGRILFLAIFFSSGYKYFDVLHKFTWYFGSTILVVILWFLSTWLFEIKDVPIYGDIKNILKSKG